MPHLLHHLDPLRLGQVRVALGDVARVQTGALLKLHSSYGLCEENRYNKGGIPETMVSIKTFRGMNETNVV